MKLVDLNILIYAVNRDSMHHQAVLSWLEDAVTDDEPLGLPWVVVLGFLRVTTTPRLFDNSFTVDRALRQLDKWMGHPGVCLVQETEEHWRILKGLLTDVGTAGNLTTDAHLAAIAIAHGATLVSCDSDFGRFRHLRWENPIAG